MWESKWDPLQQRLADFSLRVSYDGTERDGSKGSDDLESSLLRIMRCLTQHRRLPDLGWQVTWLEEHYDLIRDKFKFQGPSFKTEWDGLFDQWQQVKPDLRILCGNLQIHVPLETEYRGQPWAPERCRRSQFEIALERGTLEVALAMERTASSASVTGEPRPPTTRSTLTTSGSSQITSPTAQGRRNRRRVPHRSHEPPSERASDLSSVYSYGNDERHDDVPEVDEQFLLPQGYSTQEGPEHDYYNKAQLSWYLQKWKYARFLSGEVLRRCIDDENEPFRALRKLRSSLLALISAVERDFKDEGCLERAEEVQEVVNHTNCLHLVPRCWILILSALDEAKMEFRRSYHARARAQQADRESLPSYEEALSGCPPSFESVERSATSHAQTRAGAGTNGPIKLPTTGDISSFRSNLNQGLSAYLQSLTGESHF